MDSMWISVYKKESIHSRRQVHGLENSKIAVLGAVQSLFHQPPLWLWIRKNTQPNQSYGALVDLEEEQQEEVEHSLNLIQGATIGMT